LPTDRSRPKPVASTRLKPIDCSDPVYNGKPLGLSPPVEETCQESSDQLRKMNPVFLNDSPASVADPPRIFPISVPVPAPEGSSRPAPRRPSAYHFKN
jgi:hypothetical protein